MHITYSIAVMPCYLHTLHTHVHTRFRWTPLLQNIIPICSHGNPVFHSSYLPAFVFVSLSLPALLFPRSLWLTGTRPCGFSIFMCSDFTHQTNISLCFGLSQLNVPLGSFFVLYFLYLVMCLHQVLATCQTAKLLHLIYSHIHNSTQFLQTFNSL